MNTHTHTGGGPWTTASLKDKEDEWSFRRAWLVREDVIDGACWSHLAPASPSLPPLTETNRWRRPGCCCGSQSSPPLPGDRLLGAAKPPSIPVGASATRPRPGQAAGARKRQGSGQTTTPPSALLLSPPAQLGAGRRAGGLKGQHRSGPFLAPQRRREGRAAVPPLLPSQTTLEGHSSPRAAFSPGTASGPGCPRVSQGVRCPLVDLHPAHAGVTRAADDLLSAAPAGSAGPARAADRAPALFCCPVRSWFSLL